MKQINERFSILNILIIISVGIITACGSTVVTEKSAGNGSTNIVEQNKSNVVEQTPTNATPVTETKQAELVTVYDGRDAENKETKATNSEAQMVEKEFKSKESDIKQKFGEGYCSEDEANNVNIIGVAEGSFTKPNSKQKAFFYDLCRSGSSHFGVGGIMIFENEKAVSHYVYGENGLHNDIFTLSDINKNGLSELVLIDGQTHQGYSTGSITLVEFKDGNFANLGGTSTYDSNDGAVEDEKKVESNAYKISVQPSDKPIFYCETYQKKGNAEKWSLIKKSEKVTLEKDDFGKIHKIS